MIRVSDWGPQSEYADDVRRIVQALFMAGYFCSHAEAEALWERHSESYAGGWLSLPEADGDIVRALALYLPE